MLRVSNCIFRTRELDIFFRSFAPVLSFGNSNGWRILDRFNQANLESLCLFAALPDMDCLRIEKQPVSIPSPVLLSFLVVDWCCREIEARAHDLARTCSHTHTATQRYILHIVSICFYDIYLYMHVDCNEEKHLHTCRYDFILNIDIDLRKEWQKFQPPLVSLPWSHWICYQLPFSNTRLMICAYRPTHFRGQIYRSLLPIQLIKVRFLLLLPQTFVLCSHRIAFKYAGEIDVFASLRVWLDYYTFDVRSMPDVQCYICHFDIKSMSLSCHLTDVSFCQTDIRLGKDAWLTPRGMLTEPERDDFEWDFLFYLGVPSSHFQLPSFGLWATTLLREPRSDAGALSICRC